MKALPAIPLVDDGAVGDRVSVGGGAGAGEDGVPSALAELSGIMAPTVQTIVESSRWRLASKRFSPSIWVSSFDGGDAHRQARPVRTRRVPGQRSMAGRYAVLEQIDSLTETGRL